jgi:hypothetical protein
MPIVSVHRWVSGSPYLEGGTQYIENVLTLPTSPDTTTIYLANNVFTEPGDYVLFDYSESTAPTPVVGDLSQVIIDVSDLLLSDNYLLTNNTSEKKIILTLYGKADNGTQYINGTLNISSPMTIYLDATLFRSSGTYTLFDWSGGGSFTGSITNITIIPPSGRAVDTGVSPNGCAVSGSTITVKLI